MSDRFDEMGERVYREMWVDNGTRTEREIMDRIAVALRATWNEAIEAAAAVVEAQEGEYPIQWHEVRKRINTLKETTQ